MHEVPRRNPSYYPDDQAFYLNLNDAMTLVSEAMQANDEISREKQQ